MYITIFSCLLSWISDIDECQENPDLCDYGEKCVNEPGGHSCVPIAGPKPPSSVTPKTQSTTTTRSTPRQPPSTTTTRTTPRTTTTTTSTTTRTTPTTTRTTPSTTTTRSTTTRSTTTTRKTAPTTTTTARPTCPRGYNFVPETYACAGKQRINYNIVDECHIQN